MAIEFNFEELATEIHAFADCAKRFLAPESLDVLRAWRNQLLGIRTARDDTECDWEITTDRPVWTNCSEPDHNRHDPYLIGKLSTIWKLKIPHGANRISGRRCERFLLAGIASTRVSLYQGDRQDKNEVARWSFEIGDESSPGCHFHVQVKADDGSRLFPPTLSVPRWPGFAVTPIDALDFLLGEIFQESWAQALGKETDSMRSWAKIHHTRIQSLIKWQLKAVGSNTGPGWSRLKRAKPDPDVFLT